VEVLDEQDDAGSGVGSADADVVQAAVVSDGHRAGLVDAVASELMFEPCLICMSVDTVLEWAVVADAHRGAEHRPAVPQSAEHLAVLARGPLAAE
jgi:hypothetical protein